MERVRLRLNDSRPLAVHANPGEPSMSACGGGPHDVISLRTGAALAGFDADELWGACYGVSGQYLAFASVVDAATDIEDVGLHTWNIIARAINARLVEQGIAPLFHLRAADLG